MAMKIPSSESDAAMLRTVSVVRRRFRQQFLAIKGIYPSMIYYSKLSADAQSLHAAGPGIGRGGGGGGRSAGWRGDRSGGRSGGPGGKFTDRFEGSHRARRNARDPRSLRPNRQLPPGWRDDLQHARAMRDVRRSAGSGPRIDAGLRRERPALRRSAQ